MRAAGGAALEGAAPDVVVRDLTKSFGDTEVFGRVDFEIARGEAVALVGSNGTGKSTLLRCLLGLVPASQGRVTLLGTDMAGADRSALRQVRARTGLVAQKHNLVPRLSVLSNVIHGLLGAHRGPRYWMQGLAPSELRDRAMVALERVNLADYAHRRADRLSGGQSQRVAIARALICNPQFLIADEPTASLDPAAGEDVMQLFFQLVRDEGVTVVFTSHNIAHALDYGDRVLGLAHRRLALNKPARDLTVTDLRGLYD